MKKVLSFVFSSLNYCQSLSVVCHLYSATCLQPSSIGLGQGQDFSTELQFETLLDFEAINTPSHAGSSSVETAVNWIVEHESDPDIDEMPLVLP